MGDREGVGQGLETCLRCTTTWDFKQGNVMILREVVEDYAVGISWLLLPSFELGTQGPACYLGAAAPSTSVSLSSSTSVRTSANLWGLF